MFTLNLLKKCFRFLNQFFKFVLIFFVDCFQKLLSQ